jgi:hypothetical protein
MTCTPGKIHVDFCSRCSLVLKIFLHPLNHITLLPPRINPLRSRKLLEHSQRQLINSALLKPSSHLLFTRRIGILLRLDFLGWCRATIWRRALRCRYSC